MLTISIFGHGAVGLSIGSLLIDANIENTKINFFSPNKIIDLSTPIDVICNSKSTRIDFQLFNQNGALEQTNILIVCLKLYALNKLSIKLLKTIPKEAVILIVSNGIENSRLLSNFTQKIKVIDCLLYISCIKDENRIINYSLYPKIIIDSKEMEHPILKSNGFHVLFEKAGIRIEYTNHFNWEAWRKLIITSSINGACIFFDCNPGIIFASYKKLHFLKSLLREGAEVAGRLGLEFNDIKIQKMLEDTLLMPAECRPSMYADYRKNKPTEVNFLNRKIIQMGALNRIDTPLHNLIVNRITDQKYYNGER